MHERTCACWPRVTYPWAQAVVADTQVSNAYFSALQEFMLWYLTEIIAFVPIRSAMCIFYSEYRNTHTTRNTRRT